MRVLALATMSALLLSGLPPAPIDPLPAQSTAARRPAPPIDADAICAPWLDNHRGDQRFRGVAGTAMPQISPS